MSLINFDLEELKLQIRAFLSGKVKEIMSQAILGTDVTIFQIESRISDIELLLKDRMKDILSDEYGVELSGVNISDIELDKNDPNYKKLIFITQNKASVFMQSAVGVFDNINSQLTSKKGLKNQKMTSHLIWFLKSLIL